MTKQDFAIDVEELDPPDGLDSPTRAALWTVLQDENASIESRQAAYKVLYPQLSELDVARRDLMLSRRTEQELRRRLERAEEQQRRAVEAMGARNQELEEARARIRELHTELRKRETAQAFADMTREDLKDVLVAVLALIDETTPKES